MFIAASPSSQRSSFVSLCVPPAVRGLLLQALGATELVIAAVALATGPSPGAAHQVRMTA